MNNDAHVPAQTFVNVEQGTLVRIYAALQVGRENTQSLLIKHDSDLGRTTRKHRYWAEVLEKDLEQFSALIAILEGLHINE